MKKLIISAIALCAIISIANIDAGVQLNHSIKYTCEFEGNKNVVVGTFLTPLAAEYFTKTPQLIDKAKEYAKQQCETQGRSLVGIIQVNDDLLNEND